MASFLWIDRSVLWIFRHEFSREFEQSHDAHCAQGETIKYFIAFLYHESSRDVNSVNGNWAFLQRQITFLYFYRLSHSCGARFDCIWHCHSDTNHESFHLAAQGLNSIPFHLSATSHPLINFNCERNIVFAYKLGSSKRRAIFGVIFEHYELFRWDLMRIWSF